MQEAVRKGRETLCNLGYSETVNYSFVEEEYAKDFLTAFGNAKDSVIPLRNPISSDMGTMRTSLLPGLIKTAARNISRGQKTVKIFETGHAFLKSKGGKNIIEKASIAGLVTGPYEKNVWKDAGRFYDFYDLKGTLEGLMEAFKLDLTFTPFNKTFLTSGRAVEGKANGKHIAFLGELSETLAQKFDFDKKVFVFEMDVEALVKEMPGAVEFNSIPKFPETYRDISILIDKTIQSGTVCELIRKASGPLISKVELYDQFEGKKLDKGKKSLTLALSFQSPDKTLTDEEVNPIFEKIVKTLNKELGASLRE
jgi:phenylalanyl-tRNA synthetase beta chain